MIVILEGPDGSGKTTLAHRLMATFGMMYAHEGPTPEFPEPDAYYCGELWSHRFDNIVFDRFALGERVYGPILRGQDRLGDRGWATLQGLISQFDVLQLVCLPPPNICLEHWTSRPHEEFIKKRDLFLHSYATFAYFTMYDLVLEPYDWTVAGAEDRLMERIT